VVGFAVPGAGLRQAARAFVIDNGPIGGRVGRTMTLAELFISIKYWYGGRPRRGRLTHLADGYT
jgi:hypothetical protein